MPKKKFVGVDGCKYGWFAVAIDEDGGWETDMFKTISELWDRFKDEAAIILIDIPIGLPGGDKKERQCDCVARKKLGSPKASSVFPVPCRAATHANNLEDARKINEVSIGKSISNQTWEIALKIREVDELILNSECAKKLIREIHPELCFWALNGASSIKNKKDKVIGCKERIKVLQKFIPKPINYIMIRY